MRPQTWLCLAVPISLSVALGCGSIPSSDAPTAEAEIAPVATPLGPSLPPRPAAFGADRAWEDLSALTEFGPRPAGSRANAKAREYLAEQLEELGLAVERWEMDRGSSELRLVNLSAVIPGTGSTDRFVLVAPYDTEVFEGFEFVGANQGASGAAVVLELARVIAADPLAYATEIVFLDGEAVPASGGTAGSHALASRIREGGASHVRLIVFLDRVGDADLQIARDLMSHRFYREQFWEAAAELERLGAFPSDAAFETAGSVHQAFLQIGFRPVVSLSDTTYGGEPPPGPYTATEADTLEHCAPGSLETVGIVVLHGLDSIAQRLAKIDRFASSPGSVLVTDAEAEAQPATDAQAVESLQNDGQGAGSSPHSVEP
jgi:hypothetical protein